MTLIETTVTVAVVSLLAVLATPSIRAYFDALGSPAEVKGAISAAFASARAIAAKEQHYAGVRFQQDSSGKQYMIFIIHDYNATGLANGFRAVEGLRPIKLPENIGVMEFVNNDANLDNAVKVTDKTTFTVVFSPAGKMVIHDVQAINKNGRKESWGPNPNSSLDDVFNTRTNVKDPVNPVGMFVQDDYSADGLKKEQSRSSFVIYETDKFKDAYKKGVPYSEYLKQLDVIYTNPYTGTIIQGQ